MIQTFTFCFQRHLLALGNDKSRLYSHYQTLPAAPSFDSPEFGGDRGQAESTLQVPLRCSQGGHEDGAGMGTRVRVAGDGEGREPSSRWMSWRSFHSTQQLRSFFHDGF